MFRLHKDLGARIWILLKFMHLSGLTFAMARERLEHVGPDTIMLELAGEEDLNPDVEEILATLDRSIQDPFSCSANDGQIIAVLVDLVTQPQVRNQISRNWLNQIRAAVLTTEEYAKWAGRVKTVVCATCNVPLVHGEQVTVYLNRTEGIMFHCNTCQQPEIKTCSRAGCSEKVKIPARIKQWFQGTNCCPTHAKIGSGSVDYLHQPPARGEAAAPGPVPPPQAQWIAMPMNPPINQVMRNFIWPDREFNPEDQP